MTSVIDVDLAVLSTMQRLHPDNILDLACGYGRWTFYYTHWREKEVNSIGLDSFLPYLLDMKKWHDGNQILASATHLPFRDNVFDLTVFTDAIEHLIKREGYKALNECFRVSKNIIVSTPRIFVENPAHHGNTGNIHRSLWRKSDLEGYGFSVTKYGTELFGTTVKPKPLYRRILRRILPLRLSIWLKRREDEAKNR